MDKLENTRSWQEIIWQCCQNDCLFQNKWPKRLTHATYASYTWSSILQFIHNLFGLMLCSRSLLRTVLELIGRNPGMLFAVRLDVWNQFRRCTSLMWLSWRPRHRAARLTWCRRYLRFRIQDWANILFTDEFRFHLDSSDGSSRVYRCVGERYADACVILH
jgi:hypothetical protein